MSDDRKALCTCPVCGEKRYSVIGCWGMAQHKWEAHGIPSSFTINGRTTYYGPMDREHMPEVEFTKEELTFLQDLMSAQRAEWFNYYEQKLEEGSFKANEARRKYELCRSVRNKLYHMNGRDTLAPGNHEQRWWDQQHDY